MIAFAPAARQRLVGLSIALALFALACPSPRMPKGPPPEYEEPRPPSWLDAGPDASPISDDAGVR